MEEKKRPKKFKEHPRAKASVISHLFFCWQLPFLYKGYKKNITENDLYGALEAHNSQSLADKLEKAWLKENSNKTPSLAKVLVKVFGPEFALYGLVVIILELLLRIPQPILIGKLMSYYSGQTLSKDEAFIYSGSLILITFLYVITGHAYVLGLFHLGMKIRVAVSSVIYRKSLKLSQEAIAQSSIGHLVNLLSNDVGKFDLFTYQLHSLWMGPLQLIIMLGLLFWMLGGTSIIGITVFVLFLPLQIVLSMITSKISMQVALKTDQRIKLIKEIIAGVKVIKMYAWEKPFLQLIEKSRRSEMRKIKKLSFFLSFNTACTIFLARFAMFFSILAFVLLGSTINAEYVYVLTSFYEIIRVGFVVFFPFSARKFAETLPSIKRIQDFLQKPECVPIRSKSSNIKMVNLSTKWQSSEALTDVSLEITSGSLVGVIGPVGSGKSTLLQVLLQEVVPSKGTLCVGGTISYASQEPWLFDGTIRENILFGEEYMDERYHQVLKVCQLEYDINNLPFGDKGLVGERGVMLSGGQKARINLARAVYKKADLYLLDDPLSAVDSLVGRQLFQNCIQNFLANTTRVLVTHQLQYLDGVDTIFLIENGKMSASGTFEDLIKSDNEFLKLLKQREDKDCLEENITITEKEEASTFEENQQEGAVSSTIYRDYFKTGGSFLFFFFVILLQILIQVIGNGGDYFLSFWNNVEQNATLTDSFFTTDNCLYIYTGLVLLLVVVAIFGFWQFFIFCISASINLHNSIFKKVIFTPMRFFHTNSSGAILNRFSKDLGVVDLNLPLSLVDTLEIFFNVLVIVVVICVVNPWIIIPSVIMFLLFYFYRIVFLASSRNLKRIEGKTRNLIYSHVTSSLEGLPTIRAFGAQTKLKTQFDGYQDSNSSPYYMFLACDGAFGFWLDLSCVVFLAIVTLSFLFIDSKSIGAMVGLSITQSIMMTGLLQFGMKRSGDLENHMVSAERALEYSKLKEESENGTKVVPSNWPSSGAIIFKSVSLKYSEDDPLVLKDINFEIKPEERIGIVGRTGAGKSSLISVFFRLVDFEGEVIIDGCNTKKLPLEELRKKIAVIPQEPVLFSGTIRYNLDPFSEYQDSEIWNALEEVQLKSFIKDLHLGIFSTVSENGGNFSVGQRQLLCLARAVLRMNKILILDEATANVDLQTDQLIQETIRTRFKKCTVLTIAHRLNTVMDSDRILVIEDGRVVEFDKPLNLINGEGLLYKLLQESRQ